MRKTSVFGVSEVKKANKLIVLLITKQLKCNLCTDYIDDCFGEKEQVFYVEYEKSAQIYVDAWESLLDVEYY